MKAILTYHSIDGSGSVVSVDRATLERHARWLAQAGVRAIGLDALLALPGTADAVAITFDDAFANFATDAWPVLRDHGHAVTLYVPTGHVGERNGWEDGSSGVPLLPLLGWDALGRLAEEGVVLGAHSVSHPDLTRLPARALEDEIAGSAERIERETGVRPDSFAYPYGAMNDAVARVVQGRFRTAVTTELRWLGEREDPVRLPRLDVYYLRRPDSLESWGSRGFRTRLAWRRRLRRARRLLSGGA